MAPGMDSQPVSIPNFGKAANVAGAVEIEGDQNNNFAPGANEVSVDRSRKKSTRIRKTYHNTYQVIYNPDPRPSTTPRRPDPRQDGARYLQLYSEPPIPRGYPWSDALGGFAPAEEDARLLAEIQHRWILTDQSVRKLNRAVSAFRSSGRHNRSLERDDSSGDSDDVDDDNSLVPSAGISDTAFRAELQGAVEFYNRGSKKQSPVLGSLRDIRVNMNPFLSWIAGLRGDGHRSSVLSAAKSIIEAFLERDRPDDDVAETVANTVRAFGSGLEDYLSAMRKGRLTIAMETDTIEIFERLVLIFVSLLETGRGRLRSSQKGALDDDIKQLEESLSSVKNKVKRSQQEQTPIYSTLPMAVGPQPDVHGLVVAYHHFFSSLRPPHTDPAPAPAPAPPGQSGYEPRFTRGNSMMQSDTEQASKCSCIRVETIIRYMGYDAAEQKSEIDLCLKRSKPNQRDMQKLAALTQLRDYQAWLTDDTRYSALLVHGRFTSRGRVSPLSYLCARIADEYDEHKNVAVLSYFCGHRKLAKRGRSTVGPADLMCQLIGQLLSHPAVAAAYKRHPVFERNWEKKIKSKNVKDLMSAFSSLVNRLLRPHCDELVVFCLIDAINEIEMGGGGMQRDTGSVLAGLRIIVQQRQLQREGGSRKNTKHKAVGGRMVFKLLVTAPVTSLTAHKFFDRGDTIDLVSAGVGGSVPQLRM